MIKKGGSDLLYILSLGMMGNANATNSTDASIGFISMLSYCLPTVTLLYFEYGTNKIVKTIMFVTMLLLQVSRGFRFFVIQIAITFFSYYYLKKNQRPKPSSIFIFLIVLLIPVSLMTLFRTDVRNGTGADLSVLSVEVIKDSLEDTIWDNFRIYKNFYGMVNAIPSKYEYVYGRQMIIGTIVMLIPRAIWPTKISSYGGEGLFTLIGKNIASGQAYPTIGEYYYSCGAFGVLLFMGIYGYWCKKLKCKMHQKDPLEIILFSVLLGCNIQLLIRGYFPSNFWYMVFAILPVYVVKYLFPESKIRKTEA